MKNAVTTILVALTVVCVLGFLVFKSVSQTSTIEASHSSQFILNTPFKSVQKSMRRGRFESETLKINNAIMLEKKWIDKNIHFERILRKDRYWEFCGKLLAKVQVDNPRTGRMTVDLIEDIEFAIDHIEIHTQLVKPLDVGVTDLKESISITPYGDKSLVKVTSYLRLQRFVPKMYKDYAQNELDAASLQAISNMEIALRGLK